MNNPEAWKNAIAGLGKQLVEALKPVAEKMGVAAEHLYGVLVRQALVQSITYMVAWSFVIGGLFYIASQADKAKDPDDQSAAMLFRFAACVLTALVIGHNLAGILNPEYYAIKELLDAAKVLTK